jgi:hypothetical protein
MVRRLKLLVVAVLLAVPAVGALASPAHACMGEVCDTINAVCNAVKQLPDNCVR